MSSVLSYGERLQKIADLYTDGNIAELSKMCGYNRAQAFYDLMNGKTRQMSVTMVNKIVSALPDIYEDFLLTGKGPMLKYDISNLNYVDNKELINSYEVPLLPVNAVGGSLSGFSTQVMDYECEKIISPIENVDLAIRVAGDSMAPEYPSGSIIFIKKINEKAFIDWGKTYVLDTVNGVVIKNIFPGESGKIVCRSINTDYPEFEVEMSSQVIYGMYRVLLCLALK